MNRQLMRSTLILSLVVSFHGCGAREEVLVAWRVPDGGLGIEVTQCAGGAIKNYTTVVVKRGGETKTREIDDDMRFGTLRILRWGNWYLIGNDGYVVAGFNVMSNVVAVQGEWNLLPFRRWEEGHGGIEVLVTARVGTCELPGEYWVEPDCGSCPPSTTSQGIFWRNTTLYVVAA